MRPNIQSFNFFFDFLSPYSYFAWCWIRENRNFLEEAGELKLIPVNLAPLIHAHGTLGPAEIEAKRNYLMKDCLRISAIQKIPFTAPHELPFNALYALRISLEMVSGPSQFDVVDMFYRAAWEKGENLGDDSLIKSILDFQGLPGQEWLDRVGDKEVRRELKKNGKLALEYELFGLPSVVAHTDKGRELFWGRDSLEYLKLFIIGDDPLDKDKLKHFQSSYIAL
jgi:2-hydroxychromene-2-carboxylate isomerase